MTEPRIETLTTKVLAGIRIITTMQANETVKVWQTFAPRIKEIKTRIGTDLFSVERFPEMQSFAEFTSQTSFEKWAAVEVSNAGHLPEGMESLEVSGLYAVFIHKGLPSDFGQTLQHIYGSWLPASGYKLDYRPHFEIMASGYSPTDPNAEEEVWIPITVLT